MGSKKSSSASSTTTNTQDNSAVAGSGAVALAAGAQYSALDWFQSSDQYLTDLSDRSVNVGTDAGAVQLGQFNAELLGAINESQTDAVRFMTDAGARVLQSMGESATDLYSTAGANNAASWGATVAANERTLSNTADKLGAAWADTIDRSADLLAGITTQAGRTADTAGRVADAAITAFQPTDNAQAGAMRWGLLAAAGVAALVVLPRIMKA